MSLVLALCLLACGSGEDSRVKVIVGAVLIDGLHPPLEHSVVIVKDAVIAAAGPQQTTPIPAGSDKIDGAGKFLVAAKRGGTLVAGAPATLHLLAGDPLKDAANYERIERRMIAGQWVQGQSVQGR